MKKLLIIICMLLYTTTIHADSLSREDFCIGSKQFNEIKQEKTNYPSNWYLDPNTKQYWRYTAPNQFEIYQQPRRILQPLRPTRFFSGSC